MPSSHGTRKMPNAKDPASKADQFRVMLVGPTGSGKSAQTWSLPGRKFAYIFDPNTLPTIRGCDVDYEEFFPEFTEVDATLKGFNKGSKSDILKGPKREPTVYMDWVENINEKMAKSFFADYNWLIIDSATFLSKATMDRQLYINGRYGDVEDIADYRVVGSKLAEVFGAIAAVPNLNILLTGHLSTFQDDKTKKIVTQIWLPGKARNILPLVFTDVWLTKTEETSDGKIRYLVRTRPEARGLQDIRCSIPSLNVEEDVTIDSFDKLIPGQGGIGKLLARASSPNVISMRK